MSCSSLPTTWLRRHPLHSARRCQARRRPRRTSTPLPPAISSAAGSAGVLLSPATEPRRCGCGNGSAAKASRHWPQALGIELGELRARVERLNAVFDSASDSPQIIAKTKMQALRTLWSATWQRFAASSPGWRRGTTTATSSRWRGIWNKRCCGGGREARPGKEATRRQRLVLQPVRQPAFRHQSAQNLSSRKSLEIPYTRTHALGTGRRCRGGVA